MNPSPEHPVALDIGGVCISLFFGRAKEALHLPSGAMVPPDFLLACAKLETGTISEKEWLDCFVKVTNGAFSRARLMEIWNSIIGPDIPGMADAVESLARRGFRFVYFSNTSELHLNAVRRMNSFGHLVSGGIYSFSAHAMKPDPAIYAQFEHTYGVPCAYFDDNAANVRGALARGWNAHVFTSPGEFLRVMNS